MKSATATTASSLFVDVRAFIVAETLEQHTIHEVIKVLTSNGAELCTDLSNDVNLVIVDRADTKQEKLARKKFSQLATNDSSNRCVVTSNWVLDSYRQGILRNPIDYQPDQTTTAAAAVVAHCSSSSSSSSPQQQQQQQQQHHHSTDAKAIQDLAASLQHEAQQLVASPSTVVAPSPSNTTPIASSSSSPSVTQQQQHPNSPLEPLDPHRFRDMVVDKQQQAVNAGAGCATPTTMQHPSAATTYRHPSTPHQQFWSQSPSPQSYPAQSPMRGRNAGNVTNLPSRMPTVASMQHETTSSPIGRNNTTQPPIGMSSSMGASPLGSPLQQSHPPQSPYARPSSSATASPLPYPSTPQQQQQQQQLHYSNIPAPAQSPVMSPPNMINVPIAANQQLQPHYSPRLVGSGQPPPQISSGYTSSYAATAPAGPGWSTTQQQQQRQRMPPIARVAYPPSYPAQYMQRAPLRPQYPSGSTAAAQSTLNSNTVAYAPSPAAQPYPIPVQSPSSANVFVRQPGQSPTTHRQYSPSSQQLGQMSSYTMQQGCYPAGSTVSVQHHQQQQYSSSPSMRYSQPSSISSPHYQSSDIAQQSGAANSHRSSITQQQLMSPTGISSSPQQLNNMMRTTQQQPIIQQQRPIYYGHDPNIIDKISPDLCMLGCVFMIAEYQDRIIDPQEIQEWCIVIRLNGGTIEREYSDRVTHIICESIRPPIVQRAIHDRKRVVTVYWLNDCIYQKRLDPPWKVVHLPCSWSDQQRPANGKLIAVSGFEETDRTCIKEMVRAVGAKFTGYMTRQNHFLIAKSDDGPKIAKANEWNIPIVNSQWLCDIYLGYERTLNGFENERFKLTQHCDLKVSTAIFERCMEPYPMIVAAWHTPIHVTQEQWRNAVDQKTAIENDERIFPNKRLKYLCVSWSVIDYFRLSPPPSDETTESRQKELAKVIMDRPVICFSGITAQAVDNMTKKLHCIGGSVTDNVDQCTHLVCLDLRRTIKLLQAIAMGKFVVSPAWILNSYNHGQFVDAFDYFVRDESNERFFSYNLKASIARARHQRLFNNMIFYVTPNVEPSKSIITELIQVAAGRVLTDRPTGAEIADYFDREIPVIIITCDSDAHLFQDITDCGIPIFLVEFVITGILRQEVDCNSCRVEVRPSPSILPQQQQIGRPQQLQSSSHTAAPIRS